MEDTNPDNQDVLMKELLSYSKQKKGIVTLMPKHKAIAVFIVANPTMKLRDVAKHFDITQPWLSTMIHSKIFQEELAKLQGDMADKTILSLSEKLNGLAHAMTDKLIEACDEEDLSVNEMVKVQTNTLKALGYGAPTTNITNNTQVNNVVNGASAGALDKGREIIQKLYGDQNGTKGRSNNRELEHERTDMVEVAPEAEKQEGE